MLTLTSTLKAAQQQFDVAPVVSARVGDVPPEALRLSELALVYTGSEGDVSFDACPVPGTGQIARIRGDGSGNVFVQLVAPASANWGTWQQVATGSAYGGGPVAVGAFADGYVRARWIAADGHSIDESSWQLGISASWSAASTVGDAGAGNLVTGIACDGADPAAERFFWVTAGGQLFETHLAAGAWSNPLGDGGAYTGTPRVSAGYRPTSAPNGDANYFLLVTYGSPSQIVVKEFVGGTQSWGGAPTVLRAAGSSSGYSYGWGRLAETRSYQLRQVITWLETPPAPLPATVRFCVTPSHNAITGTLPWLPGGSLPAGVTLTHGLRVFPDQATPAAWWFIAANVVWSTTADSATGTGNRIAFAQEEVVDFRIDQPAVNQPAAIQVTVLNENGALATAGQAGAYRGLRQWSQLALSVGYHSSAGDESVWLLPCWIEAIAFRDDVERGEPRVTFFCVDAWGILDRLICDTALTFTNQRLDQILAWLWWHVCGDLDLNPPAGLSGITLPSFIIRAGESFGDAARRICERGGVVLRFRTLSTSADGVGWDSVGQTTVAWATGGSAYSYGPGAGQHPVTQANLAPLVAPSATSVEVIGKSTTSLSRDLAMVGLLGHELVARVIDKTLDTQAKTDRAAGQMAALLAPEGKGGEITTLANVGIEIGDQVDVTVSTAGVAAGVYTVAGLVTSWSRDHALVQTLHLEGSN